MVAKILVLLINRQACYERYGLKMPVARAYAFATGNPVD